MKLYKLKRKVYKNIHMLNLVDNVEEFMENFIRKDIQWD